MVAGTHTRTHIHTRHTRTRTHCGQCLDVSVIGNGWINKIHRKKEGEDWRVEKQAEKRERR